MSTESTTDESRAARAANLFDLRRIIGGLFTAWGVLLIILGATDSHAEIHKAAGININLLAGIGMLVFGVGMLIWAFSRPLGTQMAEAESESEAEAEEERSEDAARGGTGRDRHRSGGDDGTRT